MRNYIALFFALALSAPAAADPYLGLGIGINSARVDAPNVSPTHPVGSTTRTRHNLHVGLSLQVGYQFDKWYAEGAYAYLGAPEHHERHTGSDATFDYETAANVDENVTTFALKIGRLFRLSESMNLFAEAGAHSYRNEVTTKVTRTQTETATGNVVRNTTSTRSTNDDVALMYGIGVVTNGTARFKVALSHYDDLDRTSLTVGVIKSF